MGTFYGQKVICACGSENTNFIKVSDEYSSSGNSERFECLDCGNEFELYTP